MAGPQRLIVAGCAGAQTADLAGALKARGYALSFIAFGDGVAPGDRIVVDDAVASIYAEGPVDGLVNVLAPMHTMGVARTPFLEQAPADWRRVIEVNAYGVLNVTRSVLSRMTKARRGAIVSVTSNAGMRGVPGANAYSATHAGIQVFTQCMAQDCGDHGVRINCVSASEQEFAAADSTGVVKDSPLGNGDFANDAAAAIAFLLSAEASHITGSCIDLSGGWSLY